MKELDRRRVLQTVATGVCFGVAGCTGDLGPSESAPDRSTPSGGADETDTPPPTTTPEPDLVTVEKLDLGDSYNKGIPFEVTNHSDKWATRIGIQAVNHSGFSPHTYLFSLPPETTWTSQFIPSNETDAAVEPNNTGILIGSVSFEGDYPPEPVEEGDVHLRINDVADGVVTYIVPVPDGVAPDDIIEVTYSLLDNASEMSFEEFQAQDDRILLKDSIFASTTFYHSQAIQLRFTTATEEVMTVASVPLPTYNLQIQAVEISDSSDGLTVETVTLSLEATSQAAYTEGVLAVFQNGGWVGSGMPQSGSDLAHEMYSIDEASLGGSADGQNLVAHTVAHAENETIISPATGDARIGQSRTFTLDISNGINVPVNEDASISAGFLPFQGPGYGAPVAFTHQPARDYIE